MLSGRAKRASQVLSRRKRQPRSARGKTSRTAGVPEKPRPFVVRRYRGDDTIGVSEAAARLKVSRTTVHDRVAEKVLLARRSTKRGPEHSCGADRRTRPGGGGSRRSLSGPSGIPGWPGRFPPGSGRSGTQLCLRSNCRRLDARKRWSAPRAGSAPASCERSKVSPKAARVGTAGGEDSGQLPAHSAANSGDAAGEPSGGFPHLLPERRVHSAAPRLPRLRNCLHPVRDSHSGDGVVRGVRLPSCTFCLTSGSSQHCCSRGVGPVRNRKVAPGSTSSIVLATSVPGWSVTEGKLSAGGHLGEVHVETRPVTLASRCPGLTEWSAAGSTFPRRHTASRVTAEKTVQLRIQP